MSAEFFNGGADGFVAIMGIAQKPFTGVGCIADLMAIVGHALPLSRGGAVTLLGCGMGRKLSRAKETGKQPEACVSPWAKYWTRGKGKRLKNF